MPRQRAELVHPEDASASIAQLRAEHAVLYADVYADGEVQEMVELVEACIRGIEATSDPAFAAAATKVMRRTRES